MNQSLETLTTGIPAMIDRAARSLASATTAAEVLEARDMATTVYDAAKRAARLAKAKGAHDELIAKVHRAQADALEIEAAAKRRLADEYDAAQERGEVRANGERSFSAPEKVSGLVLVPPKQLHEARIIRDAEKAEPGIVRRVLDQALTEGREPVKAIVSRAVVDIVKDRDMSLPRRQSSLARTGKNPDRIERMRANGTIWAALRSAFEQIAGLPLSSDVVAIVRADARKAALVDQHLPNVLTWIKEFSDAWQAQAADRDGHADSRNGDGASQP